MVSVFRGGVVFRDYFIDDPVSFSVGGVALGVREAVGCG